MLTLNAGIEFGLGSADYGSMRTPRGSLLVLLVEDNKGDVFLFRQMRLDQGINPHLFVADDGSEAILLMDRIDNSLVLPRTNRARSEPSQKDWLRRPEKSEGQPKVSRDPDCGV